MDDLNELEPSVGRSFQQILDYKGDDFKETFDLTFEVCIVVVLEFGGASDSSIFYLEVLCGPFYAFSGRSQCSAVW